MININITKQLHGAKGVMQLRVACCIEEGSFVALSGASGSGKTTLLRIIAGLEEADGEITVNGDVWLDKNFSLPTQQRSLGFVHQDYALFSNMSVEQNLLFAQADKALAQELLTLTELSELKNKYPHQLSGGQQQRVAIARALMRKPKILLLDEPFSALDSAMRQKLYKELKILHKKFAITIIMVTHNAAEIQQLAQRVFVLENGHIINDTTQTHQHATAKILELIPHENGCLATLQHNNEELVIQILQEDIHKLLKAVSHTP